MAALGTVGASARTGVPAFSGATNYLPAVPTGFLNSMARGNVGVVLGNSYPQPVNPIVQRRSQVVTGDPLLTSD